jgi:cytoskeletal protein CcmA (bactofilin family)
MAIWKDLSSAKKEPLPSEEPRADAVSRPQDQPRRTAERDAKESLIGTGLTIEGTIEGSGHVRIAGRFHGDVDVQGDLTIEEGAKVVGGVRANTVTISGELEGNIEAATRVELRATGVLNGNLTAGSLTVAAGSKMRGQVEFGWGEQTAKRVEPIRESVAAS